MIAQPGAGGAAGRRVEPCAAAAGVGGACALRSHGTLRAPLRRPAQARPSKLQFSRVRMQLRFSRILGSVY